MPVLSEEQLRKLERKTTALWKVARLSRTLLDGLYAGEGSETTRAKLRWALDKLEEK